MAIDPVISLLNFGTVGFCAYIVSKPYGLYREAMSQSRGSVGMRDKRVMAREFMLGCIVLALVGLGGQWLIREFKFRPSLVSDLQDGQPLPKIEIDYDDYTGARKKEPLTCDEIQCQVHDGVQFTLRLAPLADAYLADEKQLKGYRAQTTVQVTESKKDYPDLGVSPGKSTGLY